MSMVCFLKEEQKFLDLFLKIYVLIYILILALNLMNRKSHIYFFF